MLALPIGCWILSTGPILRSCSLGNHPSPSLGTSFLLSSHRMFCWGWSLRLHFVRVVLFLFSTGKAACFRCLARNWTYWKWVGFRAGSPRTVEFHWCWADRLRSCWKICSTLAGLRHPSSIVGEQKPVRWRFWKCWWFFSMLGSFSMIIMPITSGSSLYTISKHKLNNHFNKSSL